MKNLKSEEQMFNRLIKKNNIEIMKQNTYSELIGDSLTKNMLKKVVLLTEDQLSQKYTQDYLKKNVNLYLAEKAIKLDLNHSISGYKTCYNENGSHSLIYNKEGYMASFDTQKLNLQFELSNNEPIYNACYLHNEEYIAVAHKNLFIYNNNGQELHCVRKIQNINHMEFLPNHFLLGNITYFRGKNKLEYLDTSIGEIIASLELVNNPITTCNFDGIICLGNHDGTIDLRAPKQNNPLMKVKAHKNIKEIKTTYNKLFVSTQDPLLKVFDLRNYFKPLYTIKDVFVNKMAISGTEKLAINSYKNIQIIFENKLVQKIPLNSMVESLCYHPFEDILTVSTKFSYENFIIPNSCNHGYNADVISPYMTRKEKRELEVKKLLEKIPPDLISYNSTIFEQIFDKKKSFIK